ncbi:hypothetical protein FHL06_11215 [Lactobacillus halodurans]|uniref:Uncharacterized protein n=1 Tax=Companilactobacillus halodurans TaxID=2584183 RepID=A0A5P0ZSL1_9LACO|nr:hypothetical protein [Companilactobacillus halodurans]MQS76911.1 hypothetical protein [Companilactobacillus halodurans]
MHKNRRGPINKVFLTIALIVVVIFAAVLTYFTWKMPSINQSVTNTAQTQPKANYSAIKKNINKKFNQNGRVVQIKEEHNINDQTSNKPHTVIIIKLTDPQTQKYLKASYEAVQNNQASDDQKVYIHSIQNIVSTQAKKLANNYDVIQFVYKDGKKYVPVASSQKHKDLIKPVKLSN